jgi:hypothetical protein
MSSEKLNGGYTPARPTITFRRVAAWMYSVINPTIESLEREVTLLLVGNITWRYHTGQCELIRPIQEYVDPSQVPNLQDFAAEYADSPLMIGFREHDTSVAALNRAAQELFSTLVSSEMYVASVEATLDTYESQRGSLGPQAPILTHTRKEVPKLAAEYLINNAQSLPSHYLIAAYWNSFGKDLLARRSLPEFQSIHRSRERLAESSSSLKDSLERERLILSRRFDVPAAPIPGLAFEG